MASSAPPTFKLPEYVPAEAGHRERLQAAFHSAAVELKRNPRTIRPDQVAASTSALTNIVARYLDLHPAVIQARIALPDPTDKSYGRVRVQLHAKRRKLVDQIEARVSAWMQAVLAWRTAQ